MKINLFEKRALKTLTSEPGNEEVETDSSPNVVFADENESIF